MALVEVTAAVDCIFLFCAFFFCIIMEGCSKNISSIAIVPVNNFKRENDRRIF